MKKEYTEPKIEIIERSEVHMAQTWNPGHGNRPNNNGGHNK